MTSPDRSRARAIPSVLALCVALDIALDIALGGCTVGQASSFTGRAEANCRQTAGDVASLSRPTTPAGRLAFALDRFADIERLVAEISSDIAFPAGARATALRRDWLDPARRSLRTGRTDLATLRLAIKAGDLARQDRAYASAAVAGTVGVAAATVRAEGLPRCATLFAPAGPATS